MADFESEDWTWPDLPLERWLDTYATLHMWTQIVGKIRLTLTPLINHFWNVTLYVTSRGLTTSAMPYDDRVLEIRFDFVDHNLEVTSSDGSRAAMSLRPCSVADFYEELIAMLASGGIEVNIHATPDEVENPLPFAKDRGPIRHMTRNSHGDSGGYWRKPTVCSTSSDHGSSANAARFISFGAALIWL